MKQDRRERLLFWKVLLAILGVFGLCLSIVIIVNVGGISFSKSPGTAASVVSESPGASSNSISNSPGASSESVSAGPDANVISESPEASADSISESPGAQIKKQEMRDSPGGTQVMIQERRGPEGRLRPANEPTPSHNCDDIPADAVKVFLGDNVAWFTKDSWRPNPQPGQRMTILRLGGEPVVEAELSDEGAFLFATIYREGGRKRDWSAKIERNEFEMNQQNYYNLDRTRDEHELVIEDEKGTEVINFRFLNESTFRLTGILYSRDGLRRVRVTPSMTWVGTDKLTGFCLGEVWEAAFDFFAPQED